MTGASRKAIGGDGRERRWPGRRARRFGGGRGQRLVPGLQGVRRQKRQELAELAALEEPGEELGQRHGLSAGEESRRAVRKRRALGPDGDLRLERGERRQGRGDVLERIEPVGQQVGQGQRHHDPDRLGDLHVRRAVRGQARQPLSDQAGQRSEHLVDQAPRLRSPAPAAVPHHPDGAPADDDVICRGHGFTVIS